MKLKVICQECGTKLLEIFKPVVLNEDIDLYERTVRCQEHGGNVYNYAQEEVEILDENGESQSPPVFETQQGALLSSTIVVKAFKILE